jgi:PAS domain S-box-containing protein
MDREHTDRPAIAAGVAERLSERLRLLEGAFGAAADAVIITDCAQADNPIIAVNPAFTRVTGYTADDALGRNCRFLQGTDRGQPEVDVLREAVRSRRAALVTLRNYKKDGTLFWNELRMAPVHDDQGNVTHFVGVQNDITGRVTAEQALVRRTADLERARDDLQEQAVQLADATQARDRFMATVSHEMRTPINAVLGYADLLDLELQGPLTGGQRDYLGRIRQTGRQLLDLVNDVLDLTRAEFGHLEVELADVDPMPVTEEVAALLEGQAQQKGLVLELEAPEGPAPEVFADRRRLRQILLNLVVNAIKFTDAGTITLRVRPHGGRVAFEVADTGIGIDPGQQPHVFDEFFQADPNLTRRHGGAGLGLAISRRLARLMGGDLTVASAPGRGSTFTLWLPVARGGAAGTAPAGEGAPARVAAADDARPGGAPRPAAGGLVASEADTDPATVVVFGPDEDTVTYLARTLYPDVRLVRAAETAAVADLARREHAALVVLDVSVDGGAGWQVAHALHGDAELEGVPLLILPSGGWRAARTVTPALDLGVVAFAAKLGGAAAGADGARADGAEGSDPAIDVARAEVAEADAARLARAVGRAATAAPGRGTAGGAIDVLVVDDDPDARRVTAEVLRAARAEVRESPDGEAALAAMRVRRPDVAVVDLMMPVLDGFGVLAAMRADARLRGVPVVVLTTKALTPDERAYLARTAERVIEKGEYRLSDVATLILRAATGR